MQKKISFKNSKGQRLVGVLHIPRGKGPFPAILVVPGLFANHHHFLIAPIAKKLAAAGFIVLSFTFSGNKPSQGTYKDIMASRYVKDVKKALEFLKKLKQVNKNKIGIAGHSLGAFLSLITASREADIKAIVSIASFFDVFRQIENLKKRGMYEEHSDHLLVFGQKLPKNHYQDRRLLIV
jgi:hypothetical protein